MAVFLLSLASLQGCGSTAGGSLWPRGNATAPTKQYKPLGNDLAAMAAPEGGGGVLHCQMGQGTARFSKGFTEFSTVSFDLLESQRNAVDLTSKTGDRLSLQGIFDRAGQKLIFCPMRNGTPDQQISCNSLYALDDDLAMGIRRTFDIPDAVTGSVIVCGFDATHLPPLHE